MTQDNHSGSKKDWLEGPHARSVQRNPERDYPFETSDGAPVDPVYTPDDVEGRRYLDQLGLPGE
ncbi:MAG: hypothetical protein V3S20_05595, partial [Dehalococcoidia bacterium]